MPTTATVAEQTPPAREPGVRALLDGFASGDPDEILSLQSLLSGLDRRAFGMLLFIATLPAFIPVPVGGAVSGPLVMLIGIQLLAGLHRPWLPKFVSRRGPHRRVLARFERLLSPWLARIESLLRPRLPQLLDRRAATMLTGLVLLLLGLLLSLPIPLTNYLFGALLLLFALALLERDGVLVLVGWIAGSIAIVVFGVLSGNLAAVTMRWFATLFS
jgi:hypothetical protein